MKTTILTPPSPPGPFRLLAARLADAVRAAGARMGDGLSRSALNRRVVHRLSTLSDRELSDIGLTRTDIVEASLPENGDATRFLIARRDGRRTMRAGRYPF